MKIDNSISSLTTAGLSFQSGADDTWSVVDVF